MRQHIDICQPAGPSDCEGCAAEWRERVTLLREVRELRRGLRSALRAIDSLAGTVEVEAGLYEQDDLRHPHAKRLRRSADRGRLVAARLAPLVPSRRRTAV